MWDKPAHGPSLVDGRRDKKRYSVKRPIKRMGRRKKREGIGNKCFLVSVALFVFGISVGEGRAGEKGARACRSSMAASRARQSLGGIVFGTCRQERKRAWPSVEA